MKRWLAMVLVFSVLTGAASAEQRGPMKLLDLDVDASFKREHPGIKYESVRFAEDQPDISLVRLYNQELTPFIEADVWADLSESVILSDAVSRMPLWIQRQVTTQDGRIVALPVSALVRPFYWYQDAWDAAGLTQADVPRSFTELLDFLDRWTQNPAPNVCVSRLTRWGTGNAKYDYVYWLMELLMLSHEMQQQYAGEPVSFDTPQFIELAERSRQIGLRLAETEPSNSKRQGMLQLFQNDIYGGEHANNGRAYGLSHSVPLRLTSDQPALTRMNLEVVFLRKTSPYLTEGLALLEHLSQRDNWVFQYALYTDFPPGDYAYDGGRMGHIDAGWLRDYREYEGDFVCYPSVFNAMPSTSTRKEKLMDCFFKGELSAPKFARELDRLVE